MYTCCTFPQIVQLSWHLLLGRLESRGNPAIEPVPGFEVAMGRDVMWVEARRAGVVYGGFAPGSFNGQDSGIAGTHALLSSRGEVSSGYLIL